MMPDSWENDEFRPITCPNLEGFQRPCPLAGALPCTPNPQLPLHLLRLCTFLPILSFSKNNHCLIQGFLHFRHGVRNSLLLAPMPTASTAQILGNNESIEAYTSNIYTRRVLSGEFQVCSCWLIFHKNKAANTRGTKIYQACLSSFLRLVDRPLFCTNIFGLHISSETTMKMIMKKIYVPKTRDLIWAMQSWIVV